MVSYRPCDRVCAGLRSYPQPRNESVVQVRERPQHYARQFESGCSAAENGRPQVGRQADVEDELCQKTGDDEEDHSNVQACTGDDYSQKNFFEVAKDS